MKKSFLNFAIIAALSINFTGCGDTESSKVQMKVIVRY